MAVTAKSASKHSVPLIRASAPLCRELPRVFPQRPFHVRFWDGGRIEATEPDSPTFAVRRPSALSHFLRAPGTLGLGRAYVDGSLTVDDLDAAFLVVDEWEPPPVSARDRVRLGLAIAAAAAPGGIPHRPSLELILRGRLHTVERDAEAVRYHYDVGNDFFALVPGRVDDLQLRDLQPRRRDAGGGAARQSSSWSRASSS